MMRELSNGPQHCRATLTAIGWGCVTDCDGLLEDIATDPSNRLCVECLSLLDGDENLLSELWLRISIAYAIDREYRTLTT